MNYHKIEPVDSANGRGCRVSLWVSGCEHHCDGCHNPTTWGFNTGKPFDAKAFDTIIQALKPYWIDGLTITGGDPLAEPNRYEMLYILQNIKQQFPHKTIWLYTGYSWEDVKYLPHMKSIDVLVDGKFIQAQKDITLQFRGSRNQRIIDVQASYGKDEVVLWLDDPIFRRDFKRREDAL